MLFASWDTHFEVEETFEVFMVNVLIAPVVDFLEQFLDVIIVTRSHLLLDDLLLTCEFQLLVNQL